MADRIMSLKIMGSSSFGNEYPIGTTASNVDITINNAASNVDTVIKNIVSGTQSVGNAAKVNGHTVNSDVPANAKFTDTVTTVDSSLSGSSTNPVQNKVVNSALNNKLNLSGGTITGDLLVKGTFKTDKIRSFTTITSNDGKTSTWNLNISPVQFDEEEPAISINAKNDNSSGTPVKSYITDIIGTLNTKGNIWVSQYEEKADVNLGIKFNESDSLYMYYNPGSTHRGIWDSQKQHQLIGFSKTSNSDNTLKFILEGTPCAMIFFDQGEVKSSNNNTWHYLKFKNIIDNKLYGFCYMKKWITAAKGEFKSWGSVYYSPTTTMDSYPFEFVDSDGVVTIGAPSIFSGDFWLSTSSRGSTTNMPGYTIIRPMLIDSTIGGYLNFVAYGEIKG